MGKMDITTKKEKKSNTDQHTVPNTTYYVVQEVRELVSKLETHLAGINRDLKKIILIQSKKNKIKDKEIHLEKKINKQLWQRYDDVAAENGSWRFSHAKLRRELKNCCPDHPTFDDEESDQYKKESEDDEQLEFDFSNIENIEDHKKH